MSDTTETAVPFAVGQLVEATHTDYPDRVPLGSVGKIITVALSKVRPGRYIYEVEFPEAPSPVPLFQPGWSFFHDELKEAGNV